MRQGHFKESLPAVGRVRERTLNPMDTPIDRLTALLGLFAVSALLALALLLTGGVSGSPTASGPAEADAACGRLNVRATVVSRYAKPFAKQFNKSLKVSVVQKGPDKVRNWNAQLFTFSGFKLGQSAKDKRLDGTERTKIRLRQPLQPGKYTLVINGDRDGCGFKQKYEIEKFRSCLSKLPIKFIDKPGGFAEDYEGFVTLRIAPRPEFSPVKDIESRIKSADGVRYGKGELPRGFRKLIGEQDLHHELSRELDPGDYEVRVVGRAPQPKACGNVSKTTELSFD